jgi:DNA-directed RNA polymerase subunit alpha
VLEIVLNLKQLRFEIAQEGDHKISLSKKGSGKVTGKEIEGDIKVINNNVYIGEITDNKTKLQLEAIVKLGIGYLSADEQENTEYGFLAVDSSFSPVKKVNFRIEEARVGRKTNFDRLILEIETDGSITPDEALKQASSILSQHFSRILSGDDTKPAESRLDETKIVEQIDRKFADLIIDELNLPSRVVNALLRENIETVADLMKMGRDRLVGLKGLGKKSIDLIEIELKKLAVELQ